MQKEIRKFRFGDKELMKVSNTIRRKVFIEEQKVDPEIEYEFEEEGNYYLLYLDDKPVATARWRQTPQGIKLERFAMLKQYRYKGLGAILLKEVLVDVLKPGQLVYLHAQLKAVNYYKRAGFEPVGNNFFEADIEHIRMEMRG
ncbi:MAG: GNAT family N-acetyltransferase [Bacteroidales bacterium]